MFNLLFLCGLFWPILCFVRGWEWKNRERYETIVALTFINWIQLAVFLALAVIVILKGYFFIQRTFIFLPIIRVALVVCGILVVTEVQSHIQWTRSVPIRKSVFFATIILCGFSFYSQWTRIISDRSRFESDYDNWIVRTQPECPSRRGALAFYFSGLAQDIKANEFPHYSLYEYHAERAANFIGLYSRFARQCRKDVPPDSAAPALEARVAALVRRNEGPETVVIRSQPEQNEFQAQICGIPAIHNP